MTPNQLCRATIENLERLARFLGIELPDGAQDYKVMLVAAILRHEMEERGHRITDDEAAPITFDYRRRRAG
jgi:hypothetical protein